MRSVPGAHFLFDWCVNAGYRNVPLSSFYPGDDVVNIIGVDTYDNNALNPKQVSWNAIYNEPDGLGAVLAFAKANGKPFSIPEWGLVPSQMPGGGGGDDPAYIDGIASVVANNNVAYQSYFDGLQEGPQFFNSPSSIAAYRVHFGANGDAVDPSVRPADAEPSPAPVLAITAGPADAAVLGTRTVTYKISVPVGYRPMRQIDSQPVVPCTSTSSEVLTGLNSGFHYLRVTVADNVNDFMSLLGRAFVVSANAT